MYCSPFQAKGDIIMTLFKWTFQTVFSADHEPHASNKNYRWSTSLSLSGTEWFYKTLHAHLLSHCNSHCIRVSLECLQYKQSERKPGAGLEPFHRSTSPRCGSVRGSRVLRWLFYTRRRWWTEWLLVPFIKKKGAICFTEQEEPSRRLRLYFCFHLRSWISGVWRCFWLKPFMGWKSHFLHNQAFEYEGVQTVEMIVRSLHVPVCLHRLSLNAPPHLSPCVCLCSLNVPKMLFSHIWYRWLTCHYFLFIFSRITFCPNLVPTTASTNRPSRRCGWTPCRCGRWSAPTCRCRPSTRPPWDWSVQLLSPSPPPPCVSTDKSCLSWSGARNEMSQLVLLNWVIKNVVKDAGFNGTDTYLLPRGFGCTSDTNFHRACKRVCYNII